MSLFSEIKELHVSQIMIILIIVITMPFFYLDVYFLNNNLFTSSPIQIPIIISFCMSICWYVIGLYMFWISPTRKEKEVENKLGTDHTPHLFILVFSLVWLIIISVICIYFQLSLRIFFHIFIGVTIFRYILNKWLITIFNN